jgi:hypothetical protein
MRKELTFLAVYWIIAASSFVWIPYMAFRLSWTVLTESIVVLVLSTTALLLVTYFTAQKPSKEAFIISSLAIALLALLLLSWLTVSFAVRYVFCAFWATFFVGTYNFVLYFEDFVPKDKPRADLAHRRYLEYGRTFFWLMLVTLIGYLTWELYAFGWNVSSGTLALLQMVSIFGIGAGIIVWAFHKKLRQIEELRKQR